MPVAAALANLVRCIHVGVLAFILLTPFVATRALQLVIYLLFIFAIVMHWIAHHHFCILSLIESKLRGIDYEDGFINAILKPIFGFGVSHRAAYAVVAVLSMVALARLVRMARRLRAELLRVPS